MRTKIKQIFHTAEPLTSFVDKIVTVKGWVRTSRVQKNFSFIEINDGSTLANLQIVCDQNVLSYESIVPLLSTGTSLSVTGKLAQSVGKNQKLELHATDITIIGVADPETYPLQKKRHSFEFLRTIAHLRPRTNTQGAVTRVRNALAFATHKFFQENGFLLIHTPIITASDCEGAGQMFKVTTLEDKALLNQKEPFVDYSKDFFGKPAYLTVSGQLNGEIYALALSDIYTFGPTFRAENSNTSRHLAEFWMIEPEMAFADLKDNMNCAENYLKYVLKYLLDNCLEDIEFFDQFIENGLVKRLENVIHSPFERLSYTDAIKLLKNSNKTFEFPHEWGADLQSEHERYLAEVVFKKPIILTDYPKDIKAFYMRSNDDGKTVAAMDVLVPKIGELIGGSQREERLDILEKKLEEFKLPKEAYWWYLDLRRYGSVPHSGFGVGFERLILFATGMENIRDVIPFPRYPGSAEF
jgi:asparaginyl-tRNA synthetase